MVTTRFTSTMYSYYKQHAATHTRSVPSVECWVMVTKNFHSTQYQSARGYHVFLLKVACQKRKPQNDDWFIMNRCRRWTGRPGRGHSNFQLPHDLPILGQENWSHFKRKLWLLYLTIFEMVTLCTEHTMSGNMEVTFKGNSCYYRLQKLYWTYHPKNWGHKLTACF